FCFKFFPQSSNEVQERRRTPQRMTTIKDNVDNLGLSGRQSADESSRRGVQQPIKAEEKIGRNDPCPCGSGKKYKHCHGKN
ncbi:MAG: hypothetical protein CO129_12540, partial [Ignavibacteriales bacterium CG_4_9_14_3_um_filter_34_10]